MRWAASIGVLVALVFLAGPAWAQQPSPTPVPTPTPLPTIPPSATESPIPPIPSDTPSPSDTPTDSPSPTDPPTPSPSPPATSSSSIPPGTHPPPSNDQAAGPSLPSDRPAGFGGFPGGFVPDSSSPVEPSPTPAESISVDDPASQSSLPAPAVAPDVPTDQSDVRFVAMFIGIGVVVFAVAAFAGWRSRDEGKPLRD
jgi:hypothetical protein